MAPNMTSTNTNGVLFEGDERDEPVTEVPKKTEEYKRKIVWRNVLVMGYLHLGAIYGMYLAFTSAKLYTTLFAIILYQAGGLGVTAGAHRLWAHRAYKAKWPVRLFLVMCNTIAFQDAVIDWARDHRVHHKYSETDADPHNATRGFFFAHVGWLLLRKHPEVKRKGKAIDLSDLKSDPILMFQKKYYSILMPLFCFVLPTVIPVYCWNETWLNAYYVSAIFRYVWTLNATWLVNSAAHIFGNRPYDRFINPSQNMGVSMLTLGEGWHNFHHVFPWDYKCEELGMQKFNPTTRFIDFCARWGWTYDLKSVGLDLVKKRVERTGDGSHEIFGWTDKNVPTEDREKTVITCRLNEGKIH